MQTSLLLPLILIATNGPSVPAGYNSGDAHYIAQSPHSASLSMTLTTSPDAHVAAIFDGCRPPVLDPREASKILFQSRVDRLDAALRRDLPNTDETPLFISRCGSEFVLFHRRDADHGGDLLYLRFEEGSYDLLEEAWG